MNRKLLTATLALLFAATLLALAYAFLMYMKPSEIMNDAMNEQYAIRLTIPDLSPGIPVEIPLPPDNRRTIIVLLPTKEQESDLQYLNGHVWQPERGRSAKLYIYLNESTRLGCRVIHKPKSEKSIMMEFHTKEAGVTTQWYGGFIDPCHDASYDYAGRAIRTRAYSWNGFDVEIEGLLVPAFEIDGNTLIIKERQLYP